MEKADTHNGDLSRRSDVLEERVAKMTHEKMTVEHNHELLKGENTRLREELERVRSGNERDKEAWRRDRENRLKSLQMDHQRDLDREAFNHQKNVDSLNAVVQDKLNEIKECKELLSFKEAELAEMKNEHTKEMMKNCEDLTEVHEKKIAQIESDHHEQMNEKDAQLKEIQQKISSLEFKRNKDKTEQMERLRKQCEDDKKYYTDLLEKEEASGKKMRQEMEGLIQSQADRFKKMTADLEVEIKRNQQCEEQDQENKLNELKNKHCRIETDLATQLDEARSKIKKLSEENLKEKSDFDNALKANLAKLERDLTEKCNAEKAAKLEAAEEDYKYWMSLKKEELDQALERAQYQANLEHEKAARMERRCNDLGRGTSIISIHPSHYNVSAMHVKELEEELREKDYQERIHALEDEDRVRSAVTEAAYKHEAEGSQAAFSKICQLVSGARD